MKARQTIRAILAATLLLAAGNSGAVSVVISNPDPTVYGNDVGGSGMFIRSGLFTAGDDLTFNVEFGDLGETIAPPGFEFGFFFSDDPNTLIPIFETTDAPAGTQSAFVQFDAGGSGFGFVFDNDAGAAQGPSFATTSDVFGFYLDAGYGTYLSNPALQGGFDNSAEFPLLADPNAFLIIFEDDLDLSDGVQNTLGVYLVDGISPVPVPAAVWLFGTALIGLFGIRKAKARA